jgi:predicted nucleic acid-binding protein
LRFWDANAVVPLTVNEGRSADMRALLTSDPDQVVWWGTRTECISALSRKAREGVLTPLDEAQARVVLFYLNRSWNEVQPSDRLRVLAEGFLGAHPLKAADALQLAAAFVWCAGLTQGREFVCLDRQLSNAAGNEGFTVVP